MKPREWMRIRGFGSILVEYSIPVMQIGLAMQIVSVIENILVTQTVLAIRNILVVDSTPVPASQPVVAGYVLAQCLSPCQSVVS